MYKIPTVLNRDPDTHGVYDSWVIHPAILKGCIPTEKLDGTNVRVTVRSGRYVRLEARKNPTKDMKAAGVVEPWYRDASDDNDADQHILRALVNTDFTEVPDGEWSGEAIGPKIQGNPLELDHNRIVIFSAGTFLNPAYLEANRGGPFAPLTHGHPPLEFEELKNWVLTQPSAFNPDALIEGVVWHGSTGGALGKIKAKDFAP